MNSKLLSKRYTVFLKTKLILFLIYVIILLVFYSLEELECLKVSRAR